MKQVVQALSGGPVQVLEVPIPTIGPTEVLVRTRHTIISAGTEHAITTIAQSNLLQKAKARPDLVRQVVAKAKTQGIKQTATTVRAKLGGYLPLGYSGCGIVEQVGEFVESVRVGQLVATGGAGKANHAEYQAVPAMLCVPVPDGVDETEAAFATVASIALHGIRLGDIQAGSNVVVIGLGLIGQLAVRLAAASGALVAGIDVAHHPLKTAEAAGAVVFKEDGDHTTRAIKAWSRGRGADCVIVAAGSASSAIMARVPALCRDRGTVVVVGDVGLELDRRPYYERELNIQFARSYGPGRYEHTYEDLGIDYPAGHLRFTEGRNLEAVLGLLQSNRLELRSLVSHRFPIDGANSAYELIERRAEPFLAIALDYSSASPSRHVRLRKAPAFERGIGFIGAGAFATSVLLPAFRAEADRPLVAVVSASGLAARNVAERFGIAEAAASAEELIAMDSVDTVVICTPHESHARLAIGALEAGKHVFCEKPLALAQGELQELTEAWERSGAVLFAGFNRRYSTAVQEARAVLGDVPLTITYRVSPGAIPDSHWYGDRRQGGRVRGEVCHFVDTCSVLVGQMPAGVHGHVAFDPQYGDSALVSLSYPNGSLAAITYGAGGAATSSKERVEILGGGRTVLIEDFRTLHVDGRPTGIASRDPKGHRALVRAFVEATRLPVTEPATRSMLASMAATLRAAETSTHPSDIDLRVPRTVSTS